MAELSEYARFFATLGVGGTLAALIFWFYRVDANNHAQAWKGQSDALIRVVTDNTAAMTSLQATTAALTTTVEALRQDMHDREVRGR